ncbi:MAG TPA: autotransporter domain-containing protein [Rhodanobacteraceae bacterium]
MLRLRHLSGALIAALVVSTAAHAGTTDFNKMVVFGDSLSDNGNLSLAGGATQPSRFTTNPGKVAVEVVGDYYGFNLQPALGGGTDFAFGGAGVLANAPGTPAGVPTITAQVTSYLNAAQNLDAHTLYTMWGGANDIFYHATAVAAGSAVGPAVQAAIAQQVQLAIANNVIPNDPTAIAAFEQQITPQVTQQVEAAVAAQAGATPETSDQAQTAIAGTAQQELKLLGQMHAAGAKYVVVFNLPDIGLTPSAKAQGAAGAAGLSGLSMIYNGVLDSGLNTLSDQGLNIVPVNVYGLFNEVVANPKAFGFDNVTTPACSTGPATGPASGLTSVECGPAGSGAPYTYAKGTDQTYLFADGVHPTTAAHKMLGQYVIAELTAPGQASMLAEAPLAGAQANQTLLRRQMFLDQNGASTRTFMGLSYGKQTFDATGNSPRTNLNTFNFTLGVDGSAGDHINAGAALGLARSNADIGRGGFRLDSIIGSGYATWHGTHGYIGVNAGFAQLSYNDIYRRFQIGALMRSETAQTDGSQIMAGLDGGLWFGSDAIKTGPFARVQWQRISVDGYSENGDDSSAMWFGKQQRFALIGTLGWQLTGNWKVGQSMLHPYVNVAWDHDSRAGERKVRAGLTSMQGSFALTGFIPDSGWIGADLGLTAQISPTVSTWFAYQGRFGDSNQRSNNLNMGVKIAF